MTDHELIIEAAKLDGFKWIKSNNADTWAWVGDKAPSHWFPNYIKKDHQLVIASLPDYLHSRDAIVRVIEKQPLAIKRKIAHEFYGRPKVGGCIEDDYIDCICASARRLTIALVKAAGTYKE